MPFITLTTKPSAQLHYDFYPAKPAPSDAQEPIAHSAPLLVFLNGLTLPASSWAGVVARLTALPSHPALLTYDRYGQGLSTDHDPTDPPDTPDAPDAAASVTWGHDSMTVVNDLHQLLLQISAQYDLVPPPPSSSSAPAAAIPPLFFIGNSIGCSLARLYTTTYAIPSTNITPTSIPSVRALLFLDSVLANTDFVSYWPDPDAPDFAVQHEPLPAGVTSAVLRDTRGKFSRIFHATHGSMGRAEGFHRRNLAALLPEADAPSLVGGAGGAGAAPWVTVVGHGWEAFAQETLERMGTPKIATMTYANTFWWRYNEGLAKLTSPEHSKGPVEAVRSSHFIQKDDPDFVTTEILELLGKMEGEGNA